MKKQNNAKSQIKLDNYSKQKLAHAYMSLYDALVAEYQAQSMTLGKSWYNALKRIHEIVKSKKDEQQNVVLEYLMSFYNSHREAQLKKMMIAKDKDLTIQTNTEKTKAATARVQDEIKKFDDAVKSITDGEVLVVLDAVKKQPKINFFDWAEKRKKEITIDFDNDPRSFERIYKQYIMQQKNK